MRDTNELTKAFIENAQKVHMKRYSYSKTEYKNARTKVCITCPEHGDFWQLPRNHLRGQKCKLCSNKEMSEKKSRTKEEFIKKAREIHGDAYDYSKIVYRGSFEKVCIVCPEHGEFWQSPAKHLEGNGCKQCYYDSIRKTTKEFVKDAKRVHGNKYSYKKVRYKKNTEKVCIICPEHGEFWQTPKDHLRGRGCPLCADNHPLNIELFIERAKSVHGEKYDYSKVDYRNNQTKVIITCPKHGDFLQAPSSHLEGCGCPTCKESQLEKQVRVMLETMGEPFVYEKTFDWLVNGSNKLSIDFYLPRLNKAIECQGQQHFEFLEYFHRTKEGYKNQIVRDEKKNKECKENKVSLLYFAEDKDYVNNYKYPVITNIEDLRNTIFT